MEQTRFKPQTKALPRPQQKVHTIMLAFTLIAVLAVLTILWISAYVGWNLTHPKREYVNSSPEEVGLSSEDIVFKSREDGLHLKGWLIKALENKKTVIFAHGYRKNRLQNDVPVLPIARELVSKGYNVVMFDFRNCGESEGNLSSVGQFEVRDLLGAVDYIKSRDELSQKIVLFGFSMGAATSILAGAREPAVSAVIADSPFADLKTYLMDNLSVWTNLPAFPFNQAFLLVVPPLTGLKAQNVSPLKEINNFNGRPILIIHGEADTDIPIDNSESLVKAYAEARLLKVPKAEHVKAFATAGDSYLNEVFKFIDDL